MAAVVVTPRPGHPVYKRDGGLAHAATLTGDTLYIWCWGDAVYSSDWDLVPEGTPVTCFQCLALGPRGEWRRDGMFGRPAREEMIEGRKFLSVDYEEAVKGPFELTFNGTGLPNGDE